MTVNILYRKNTVMTPWAYWFRKTFWMAYLRGLIHGDFIGMFYRPIWFSKLFGGEYLQGGGLSAGGAITDIYCILF